MMMVLDDGMGRNVGVVVETRLLQYRVCRSGVKILCVGCCLAEVMAKLVETAVVYLFADGLQ